MTEAKLRKQFKAAEQRVSKAIFRYKQLILKLYMPYFDGARQSDMSGRNNGIADVYLTCLNSDGTIREYATQLSWTFYRRGRDGKFYEKPQPKTYCQTECGKCTWCDDNRVSQDYLDLCKLETAIDTAVDEREQLRAELENIGVDTWHDATLWQ